MDYSVVFVHVVLILSYMHNISCLLLYIVPKYFILITYKCYRCILFSHIISPLGKIGSIFICDKLCYILLIKIVLFFNLLYFVSYHHFLSFLTFCAFLLFSYKYTYFSFYEFIYLQWLPHISFFVVFCIFLTLPNLFYCFRHKLFSFFQCWIKTLR